MGDFTHKRALLMNNDADAPVSTFPFKMNSVKYDYFLFRPIRAFGHLDPVTSDVVTM